MVARRGVPVHDRNTGVDRKTVRRYTEAAMAAGLVVGAEEAQLADDLIGLVCATVRPDRPRGYGGSWERIEPHAEVIRGWVKSDLTLVKVHDLWPGAG